MFMQMTKTQASSGITESSASTRLNNLRTMSSYIKRT